MNNMTLVIQHDYNGLYTIAEPIDGGLIDADFLEVCSAYSVEDAIKEAKHIYSTYNLIFIADW